MQKSNEHMEVCSILLVTVEIQWKNAMKPDSQKSESLEIPRVGKLWKSENNSQKLPVRK